MKLKSALLLSLLGTAWLAIAAAPAKTQGGLVEGTVADGLTIYRGIPFAAPPVGDLRWRPPQPAAKWAGTLAADKFAASCMQGGRAPNPNAKGPAPQGPGASEDCLYLNGGPRRKRPAMVCPCWFGFTAADLPAAPHRFRSTAASNWQKKAWYLSASRTVSAHSDSWRILV